MCVQPTHVRTHFNTNAYTFREANPSWNERFGCKAKAIYLMSLILYSHDMHAGVVKRETHSGSYYYYIRAFLPLTGSHMNSSVGTTYVPSTGSSTIVSIAHPPQEKKQKFISDLSLTREICTGSHRRWKKKKSKTTRGVLNIHIMHETYICIHNT